MSFCTTLSQSEHRSSDPDGPFLYQTGLQLFEVCWYSVGRSNRYQSLAWQQPRLDRTAPIAVKNFLQLTSRISDVLHVASYTRHTLVFDSDDKRTLMSSL